MIDEESRHRLYARYRETQAGPELSRETHISDYAGRAYGLYFQSLLPRDKASRFLDLGCGRGDFLAFLRSEGYESLAGVEFSADQVEYAKQTGISTIIQKDIQEFLSSCTELYDCVIAIDVLEHFDTHEAMSIMASIYRILSPGGRFIMRAPNAGSPFFGSIRYGDLTHETAFTRSSVVQLFRNIGFNTFGVSDTGPRIQNTKTAIRWMIWHVMLLPIRLFSAAEPAQLITFYHVI